MVGAVAVETRTYLRLLVKRIVINEDLAEIEVRTDGAAALMAQGGSSSRLTELNCPAAVLTSVTSWLGIWSRLQTRSTGEFADSQTRIALSTKQRMAGITRG
jgi:hypothetical protein